MGVAGPGCDEARSPASGDGRRPATIRTTALTTLAMVGFAANSILCRAALGGSTIDAASFSALRLASGAGMLALLCALLDRSLGWPRGDWPSAALLVLYAVPFAFAYESLGTGTGALILFGAVQVTMILAALWSGERPRPLQWLGLAAAGCGLVYLALPGLDAPDPVGAVLMATAGMAWGLYSLRGRSSLDPLRDTAGNFLRSVPMVALVSLLSLPRVQVTPAGVALALVSGAIATSLVYVIWYAALRGLTATLAATVQLSVPVIAAAGGVVFLAEDITLRLAVSSVLVLGGVAVASLWASSPRGR